MKKHFLGAVASILVKPWHYSARKGRCSALATTVGPSIATLQQGTAWLWLMVLGSQLGAAVLGWSWPRQRRSDGLQPSHGSALQVSYFKILTLNSHSKPKIMNFQPEIWFLMSLILNQILISYNIIMNPHQNIPKKKTRTFMQKTRKKS